MGRPTSCSGRCCTRPLTPNPRMRATTRLRRARRARYREGQAVRARQRMKSILEEAAQAANAQMRVQSFADRRPDRIVWDDRQWQWASLRFEDGDFNTADHVDLEAREKWFYQAIGASPAMFRRDAHAGSLYWLGVHDDTGSHLDGGRLSAHRAHARAGEAVLVGHGLRHRHAVADPDRAGQGGVALAVRTEGRQREAPLNSTSAQHRPKARKSTGFRPFRVRAGSPTSASTDPRWRHSTGTGSPPTFTGCRRPDRRCGRKGRGHR